MNNQHDEEIFLPPDHAPALLTFDQVRYLAVHGWLPISLPPDLLSTIDDFITEGNTFFSSPPATKAGRYPPSNGTECGFYSVPDEKEYITFRHTAHEVPSTPLQTLAADVWSPCAALLHRILVDLSRAGSLDLDIWDSLVSTSLTMPSSPDTLNSTTTLLRLFNYLPPPPSNLGAAPPAAAAPPHVDIGLLTLSVSTAPGLQVLDRQSNTYVDAPGSTIVVGDALCALLNGRVHAGLHRVVVAPERAEGRRSVVLALRPELGVGGSAEVDLGRFGRRGGKVVNVREWFVGIKGKKFNVNAVREVRERQMAEQKAAKEDGGGASKKTQTAAAG